MTIQPSVVIWTVICFAALYFILKYLLFDPVLKVMDKREKKIADSFFAILQTAKAATVAEGCCRRFFAAV